MKNKVLQRDQCSTHHLAQHINRHLGKIGTKGKNEISGKKEIEHQMIPVIE